MTFTVIEIIPIAVVVVVVVVILVVAVAGRGKKLKCPECGNVFKAPATDNKLTGLGWTLPYLGTIKCRKCGQSRSRRDYLKVPAESPAPLTT